MLKPVRLRQLAAEDVADAVDHLAASAGSDVAERFVDALERALGQVARLPGGGSLRFAYELDIPGLRVWPLHRYPYLLFYLEHAEHLEVWRVLHTRRDLPPALTDVDEG